MSLPRFASRVDSTQRAIVAALRHAGADVEIIRQPCDIAVRVRGFPPGMFLFLECKPESHTKALSSQAKQEAKLQRYGIRKVRTPEEALDACGLTGKRWSVVTV
jgi:hypothetical protein